ncbi:hypothetical protein [Ammoniphilus sp. YIM 78166]|uniref:hypothetical protein n=1 Tax=Ammoniphilus sp. YIM 78166 TaxID=1644106 RepID=UPI001431E1C7|nr:hypothetical protein [Ammoniphilus sp. YIM 78166]
MNQATDPIQVVKFRFLAEFRGWLEENKQDKEIIDIQAQGGLEDMVLVVTYKDR